MTSTGNRGTCYQPATALIMQYYYKIAPGRPYFGFAQDEGQILTCGW